MSPHTPLNELDWMPPRRIPNLRKLGLVTLRDLVMHFPRRYEDRRHFAPFPDAPGEQPMLLCGEVIKAAHLPYGRWRRGYEAILAEPGGGALARQVVCRWFNMPYIARMIATGMRMVVFGRLKAKGRRLILDFPEFEIIEDEGDALVHLNRIVPVHPAGEGLTPRRLREWIFQALHATDLAAVPSLAPGADKNPDRVAALRAIHFPESAD
ncbi:MAG: hypothetical protein ACREKL_00470, partial [Chthoniobacterales bacterium]